MANQGIEATETTQHYVLTWLSDTGEMTIVGPFDGEQVASAFGRAWQAAHGDNPCWQSLTRPDGTAPRVTHAGPNAGYDALSAPAAPIDQVAA